MNRIPVTTAALAALLALSGCGLSDSDRAMLEQTRRDAAAAAAASAASAALAKEAADNARNAELAARQSAAVPPGDRSAPPRVTAPPSTTRP